VRQRGCIFDALKRRTPQTTQIRKLGGLEGFCSVKKVRKIKVGNVITNDKIRVDLFNEISPFLEHLCFIIERDDL